MHQQSQFRPPTQALPPILQSTPQFMAPLRQQSSLEESLKTFMQSTSQAIQEIKSSTHLNTQTISKLENQVGQLATQVGGKKESFLVNLYLNQKGSMQLMVLLVLLMHMNLFSLLLPLGLVSKLIIK